MTNPVVFSATHPILAHPIARWLLIVAVAATAGAWIAILAVPHVGGDEVIIHYTTTFGIDALGSWHALLRFPITGTVFVLMNTAIAFLLVRPAETTDRVIVDASGEAVAVLRPPAATMLLLAATALIAAAVLLGCIMLWRVNVGGTYG